MTEEWDWPPRRRRTAPTIEGRIERERVVLKRRPQPQESWPNRTADLFFRVVLAAAKAVIGAVLGLLLFACIWFAAALFHAAG